MKTLFSQHKWMQIIYGLILITSGILVIVISLNSKESVSQWLSIVVAISLFIYAAALMFTGIFSLKKSFFDLAFIYAVLFVAIGVTLIARPLVLGSFLTIFIATALCAAGVVEMGEATAMVFFKRPAFFIVLFYVIGTVLIALGVLAFSFQEQVETIMYVAAGAILALAGASQLILGIVSLFRHETEDAEEGRENSDEPQQIVDANVSDPEPTNDPVIEVKPDDTSNGTTDA